MRSWSIFAGRLFGVEFRIHLTFLFLLLFVLLNQFVLTGSIGVPRSLGLVAIICGSVLLHELGHAVVATRVGVPVRGIMLLPIVGVTVMDPQDYLVRFNEQASQNG